jgi:hypothetical protein
MNGCIDAAPLFYQCRQVVTVAINLVLIVTEACIVVFLVVCCRITGIKKQFTRRTRCFPKRDNGNEIGGLEHFVQHVPDAMKILLIHELPIS